MVFNSHKIKSTFWRNHAAGGPCRKHMWWCDTPALNCRSRVIIECRSFPDDRVWFECQSCSRKRDERGYGSYSPDDPLAHNCLWCGKQKDSIHYPRPDILYRWCTNCRISCYVSWNGLEHTASQYIRATHDKFCRFMLQALEKYGLKPEGYYDIFKKQFGRCAICACTPGELRKMLRVDHSHTTLHVRGLLCSRCNLALGNLPDDSGEAPAYPQDVELRQIPHDERRLTSNPEWLKRAIAYLRTPTAPPGIVPHWAKNMSAEEKLEFSAMISHRRKRLDPRINEVTFCSVNKNGKITIRR